MTLAVVFVKFFLIGYLVITVKFFFIVINTLSAVTSFLDFLDMAIIIIFLINSKFIKENKILKNLLVSYNITFLKFEIYFVIYSIYYHF